MKKERFVEFLEDFIFGRYTNNLIILDNAGSHKNNYVKNAIEESDNKYLFSVPYNPKTNGCIEMFFNQMKHYMKLSKRKTLTFDKIKKRMMESGDLMISYQPFDKLPNFFRIVFINTLLTDQNLHDICKLFFNNEKQFINNER